MDKLSQVVATRPAKKNKSCTVCSTPDDVALPHNLQLTSSRRFKLEQQFYVLHFVIQKKKTCNLALSLLVVRDGVNVSR
jgi:hypothetical protein